MTDMIRPAELIAALTITLSLPCTAAVAGGFKAHDLTPLEKTVVEQFAGADYHWATPSDMSISCCGNDESLIVSVSLDRQTDEMDQENRTDEAYIAELENSCRIIGCKIQEIDVGSSIGRLLEVPNLGGGYKGVNVFVVEGSDRLTIKSAAKTMEAKANAMKALDNLSGPIIGR